MGMVLFVLMGVVVGLLGAGGSIISVPILVYALGMKEKAAIATSLVVVSMTSATAATQHALAGNVHWRVALVFSVSGMAGGFIGGSLARFLSGPTLLMIFAVIMLGAAVAMWQGVPGVRAWPPERKGDPSYLAPLLILEGFGIGLVTGLVGAGGGFLIVPALALLVGLPMHQAVGSSLVVIALISGATLSGYVSHVDVNYVLAGGFAAAAISGSLVGARLGGRLSQGALRHGFAALVFVMALYMLYKEAPGALARLLGGP